jgi:hypothetical protein
MVWTSLVWGAAAFLMGFGSASVEAAEPGVAVMRDGRRERGSLAESDGQLVWRSSDGRNSALSSLRWVDGAGGAVASPRWPLRQVAFRGGGSLTAGWIGSTEKSVRLSLWNNPPADVPVAALEAFGPLETESDLLFDDFSESRGDWSEDAGRVEIVSVPDEKGESALRLTAGTQLSLVVPGTRTDVRITLRYLLPSTPQHPAWKVALRAAGPAGDGPTEVLSVRFGKDEESPRLSGVGGMRVDHQELRPVAGWRQLTLLVQDRDVRLLIDGQLRAAGRMPTSSIDGVLLAADAGALPNRKDAAREPLRSSVLIDDVQIQALVPSTLDKSAELREETRLDALQLRSGDALFGAFERATPMELSFAAAGQKVSPRWKDVERVTLAARPLSTTPVEGEITRLWLRGPSDRPVRPIPGDSLIAAVVSSDRDSLGVHHPTLGRFFIPQGAVRRMEPRYRGRLQMIDVEVHHLGTAVRGEFRRPLPERAPYSVEFEADEIDAGARAEICVATRDVEPCGRGTPPGSPHLAELRAGGLLTEVTLNGVSLGDLNSRLTWKQASPDDLVVRLSVPEGCLKKGRNTLRLSQRSARLDPESFDDCEVGPVWIETRRAE